MYPSEKNVLPVSCTLYSSITTEANEKAPGDLVEEDRWWE